VAEIFEKRMTGELRGDFVLFLIGLRFNRLWKIHKWLPVVRSMPRMIRELAVDRESGFLGCEMWFGRTTIIVQYWRTFDQLESYAKNNSAEHLPAWAAFNRNVEVTATWASGTKHFSLERAPTNACTTTCRASDSPRSVSTCPRRGKGKPPREEWG